MDKKIAGKQVYFTLGDDGMVECKEFDIKAETFQQCLELVKKEIKELDAAARVYSGTPVMVWQWRNGYKRGKVGKADGDQHWVIYDDGEREKVYNDKIYNFDQTIMNDLAGIAARQEMLEEEEEKIKKRLVCFKKAEEGQSHA